MTALPRWRVPRPPAAWDGVGPLWEMPWQDLPAEALVLADGGGAPAQPTLVRLCADEEALYVRFDCDDRDAWGTYGERDDPIYEQEVVEVFIAAGAEDPRRYLEFEVAPTGVFFDAVIDNPNLRREGLGIHTGWDAAGARWLAGRAERRQDWWACLRLPWSDLAPAGERPRLWRANFYRIERPRDGDPEHSAWSPTGARPPEFHLPARFGVLEL